MPFSGSQVSVLGPWGVSRPQWASFAGKVATTISDERTVFGRVIVAFTDGDKFRIRAVRTEGGSDLQTAQNGSAIQLTVFKN